jgi:anhydro-N-acetylmuramic acid kinase
MISLFQKARLGHDNASLEDLLATACLLCVLGILHAATGLVKPSECDLIVSGGGVENRCIIENLRKLFPGQRILRSDDFGIPAAAKEALAFALLGAATLDGIPSNIPSATGASRSVVLGSITPK